jgi:hypothetical protein
MTQEGCEPCSFTQVTAPGVITTYAAQPWPRGSIAEELMNKSA